MSWRSVDPSPGRGWIRFAPRAWPAVESPYLDLAQRRLIWPSGETGKRAPSIFPPPSPDLTYLPPIGPERKTWRDEVAKRLAATGALLLQQDLTGRDRVLAGGGLRVIDLTPLVLAADSAARAGASWADAVEPGEAPVLVVVPLIPGLTPGHAELGDWLDPVAGWRPNAILGVAPELSPHDRRGLVGLLGDEAFEAVFHGRAPTERELSLAASERDLSIVLSRPAIASLSPRAARNRRLAARLAEAGELWLGLDRAEAEGAALLAAARHVDTSRLDIAALAREGNLSLLDFLVPISRRVIEEELEKIPGGLLVELRALWGGRLK